MSENRKNICAVLIPYLAIFPDCKLTKEGVKLYADILEDKPAEKVAVVMKKLCKTSKFFPRIADIVEAIEALDEYQAKADGQGTLTPAEAWEAVMETCKSHSIYSKEPWVFVNADVERSARMFGLLELASIEAKDINIARAQYMRIYASVVSQRKEEAENKKLLAIARGLTQKMLGGKA